MNPEERVLRSRDEIARVLEVFDLLGRTVDCDDAFVASRERLADADLGFCVGTELLDDLAAAADYAADLANGAEVAVDGVF